MIPPIRMRKTFMSQFDVVNGTRPAFLWRPCAKLRRARKADDSAGAAEAEHRQALYGALELKPFH
jgi:hypothetical protein